MNNEIIKSELKNIEEKLETANKELFSYRLEKSEIEYQKKTLEGIIFNNSYQNNLYIIYKNNLFNNNKN
jgi:hypothetical protein